jgi:hypothetical protein
MDSTQPALDGGFIFLSFFSFRFAHVFAVRAVRVQQSGRCAVYTATCGAILRRRSWIRAIPNDLTAHDTILSVVRELTRS